MLIMISSQDKTLDSEPSLRFGRAPYFILYDIDHETWKAFENQAVYQRGGAGVAAAQFLSDKQVDAALSGRFGPNAHQSLSAAGIKMLTFDSQYDSIHAVVDAFKAGDLSEVPGS